MLGPLPTKYRFVVAACALVAFIGVGAWAGLSTDTMLPSAGAVVGATLGVGACLLLLHDFSTQHPRAARVHARRIHRRH